MTDMRRANEARIHQPPTAYRGASCNSTPEHAKQHQHNSTYPAPNGHPIMFSNSQHAAGIYRTPLLQTLADHMNMSSASGGSTSSSATANIANVGGHCNGNLGGGEVQFDEREIYYVSPSKRKGNSAYCAAPTTPQSTLRSCESRLKVSASIAPSYPAITPSAAYGARTSGQAHDFSFEHSDNASHYSDTAMQLLRSGSCSVAATASNLITSAAGNCSSSNSSLAQQHVTPVQRSQQNVVTFSSPLGEERPAQFRGSLRRGKGRSSQSLCSCDAGDDTEINPDPTRPLYQYSLERRQKGHTYTCEQNAQILMRLERERNRRLSLGASRDDVQSDTPSSSDVDNIPPIPPPPAMKRNGSMRSLRHFQRPASNTAGNQNINNKNSINNNLHSSIATLCNSDILNDCANNALEVGSLIDDCTTSILKCANVVGSELMAATTATVSGIGGGSNSITHHKATLATIASSVKPDVCHVTTPYGNGLLPHCIRDDIHLPSSGKKSDPALCFLHVDRGGSFGRAPLNTATHQTQSKYNTIGPSSDCARQLSSLLQKQQQQQHQQRTSSELRAVTERCRCLSQSLSNFSRDYFGQSGHKGPERVLLPPTQRQQQQQQQKHHYYANKADDQDWLKEPPPPPPPAPYISRSYGDLMDIDSHTHAASQLAFGIKCSGSINNKSSCKHGEAANSNNSLLNPLKNSSFTTLTSIASSGLKEKLQQQQQHPLLHPHQQKQELQSHHNHHHHQQHHPHHHHALHQQQQQQLGSSAAQQQKQQQQLQLHASVSSIMPWKHRQCPSRGSSSSGTNSFRFDAAKHWLAVSSILLIIGAASVAVPLALRVAASAPFEERLRVAVQLLDQVPLIDGHNDLPWNIRKFLHNKLNDFNFDEDLRNVMPWARSHWSHTDLQRLKKGRISAQFWAAYVPCEAQHRDAVQLTLEQIDVIKRLTDRYAPQLTTCTSAEDIKEAHKNHQLCSLTGVEGGHSLGGSLAVLRTLYAIGVRYMTLTSTCHTPWADSSYADAPTFNVKHGGLTIFGKTIIREMNRLGMMVDLSHVSTGTMRDALEVSEAPVIFSHSSAYEVCNSSRNVQDDMLHSLAKNGGLVMVNFYSKFLSCSENSTVHDAVAHINHIKRIAGIDHVGLGAGFDGINFTPKGLEDVSSYPTLFAELLGVGWSIDDLAKLAGGNFLRVMQQVEKVRDEKKAAGVKPYEDHPNFRTDDPYNCTSS